MKLSLKEAAAKLDQDFGRLSTIQTTEQVIRSKFKLAGFKAQKRRSQNSWAKMFIASGVMGRKATA